MADAIIAAVPAEGTGAFLPPSLSAPFLFVTNSVRWSISAMLNLLRNPLRYVTVDLPAAYGYLEPGDTVWASHQVIPGVEPYRGKPWQLVPLYVVSVTDYVHPAKIGLKCLDLREVYRSWWSPFLTDIGMGPDLNGIARIDRGGGFYTDRSQLAYGERYGGDNVWQEVGASKPLVDGAGLWVQGGADTNHLLNSTLSEGSGNTFTSWTPTTTGAAVAVEWRLYTLIDSPDFQRSCQLATYAAGEAAYLSQTVNSMGGKKLYLRVFYKNGGATDDLVVRIQRSVDSKYWRDSDATWQVAATDNVLTPKSGVVNSLRWVSKEMDLTLVTTNLTISVGHISAAAAIPQITQIQGVELIEIAGGAYERYRSLLPTRGAAVTRVTDWTYIVNDAAVRVLSPTRGFFKLTFTPRWSHADLADAGRKYILAADFDGATDLNFFRLYYHRTDATSGEWVFENGAIQVASVDATGNLATKDQAYVIACRWTSSAEDEFDLGGQALDIWVDGVRGNTFLAATAQVANSSCNVYLGGTPNYTGPNNADGYYNADGQITRLTIGEHCPTDDELQRI